MKPLKKTLLLIFLCILTSFYGFSQEAKRIVSLAPSVTNMLYLMNSQDRLVGCTNYCLEGVKEGKSVVATAIEVNVEKVFLLKPDIVFTAALTKPSTLDAIRKLGIKVVTFQSAKTYDEICKQFIQLSKFTSKESFAQNLVKTQKHRLDSLKKKIPVGKKPKIFFEIGAKPLFTAVPNTFMNDFITQAGGVNIATDLSTGAITRENVILKNPDAIVIVTMGIVGVEEKATWEKYRSITATKNGKVFIVDPYKSCGPNPVTFVDVVEELVNKLYK